ncbi:MAG: hypothetical protein ACSHXW_00100 [Yoonia sp.]
MIYFARLSSLTGGTMALVGFFVIGIKLLYEPLLPVIAQGHWLTLFFFVAAGCCLLFVGQIFGNDLFSFCGRNSVFSEMVNPPRSVGFDGGAGYLSSLPGEDTNPFSQPATEASATTTPVTTNTLEDPLVLRSPKKLY